MSDLKNLTVIVPFYNGHEYINKLIQSIPRGIPVIVVDDHSSRPLLNLWDTLEVTVIRPPAKGYFAGAVNAGIQACDTDVLVLNQDTWFENSQAFELVDDLRNEGYAMIGERINGTHPTFGDFGYIHGTFMFIRRDALRTVGLLNAQDYPLWGTTAEYQLRLVRKSFAAIPLKKIPGFCHARSANERYGSSIKNLLDQTPTHQKNILIQTPPLLSVVVPCYNYGRYINDCLNSLIGGPTSLGEMPGQTLQSFEVIIVDDASTDDSPAYIQRAVNEAKGIRAYRLLQNVGTAKALNYGIEKAVGKYITFLSADDMREPTSLQRLVETCEENPHSFAYDDVWLFHKNKKIKEWRMEEYNFEKLIWKNHVHAGIVFPKRAWQEVGGYPAIMGDGREDWAFNVALGVHGWCGVHVRELGYLYRREGQNRTEHNTTEEHRQQFLGKIMSLFPNLYKGERPVACCGKGSNKKASNNGTVSNFSMGGSLRMANQIGSEGMVKIEYIGQQMASTWHGEVTKTRYTFGIDRPRGWVDKRDLGGREEKKGFLGKKDRNSGTWLFRTAGDQEKGTTSQVVQGEPVPALAGEVENTPDSSPATTSAAPRTVVSGTLQGNKKAEYDPDAMNVEEIRQLQGKKLSKVQWDDLYRRELAGRNRKGAVAFLEEMLAADEG